MKTITPRYTYGTEGLIDDTIPPLQRVQRQYQKRAFAFYDARQGVLTLEDGKSYTYAPHGPLSVILDALVGTLHVRTLYLIAGMHAADAPAHDYYRAPAQDGWTVTYRPEQPPRRTATYTRNGATVDVRHTAAWFDDARDVDVIRRAYLRLQRAIVRLFGEHATLLGTPAQTGLDLLERSLPFERQYPTLTDEYRTLIQTTATQARIELYPEPYHGATVEDVYHYDMRLAYGSCLRAVPCWLEADVESPEIRLWQPALYEVVAQVPEDWKHIGLLPAFPEGPGDRWHWPRRWGDLGASAHGWFHTWAGWREVQTALGAGWRVKAHRALFFATKDTPGADPLHTWADKLTRLYGAFSPAAPGADDTNDLCRAAIRNLILHTVGSLNRHETVETQYLPLDQAAAIQPAWRPQLTPWGWEVHVPKPLDTQQLRYAHPEIAHAVWEACRVKLAQYALDVPFDVLLGCNTDAWYLRRQAPWSDDGRVGAMRVKGHVDLARDPQPWPADEASLHTLREWADAEEAAKRDAWAGLDEQFV